MDSDDDDFEACGEIPRCLGTLLEQNLRIGTPHSILECPDVLDSSVHKGLFILWIFEAFKI